MGSIEGKIEKKEELTTTTGNPYVKLTISGVIMSAFENQESLKEVSVGTMVKAEYTEKGQYKNLSSLTVLDATPKPQEQQPVGQVGAPPNPAPTVTRELAIVRQNALAHADAIIGATLRNVSVEQIDDALMEEAKKVYFEFAEACEAWVVR